MGFIWLIYAVSSVLISLSSFLCLSLYILFSSAFSQLKRLIHQSPNSVLFVLLIGMSKQNVVGCGFSLQRPCSFLHCSSWHFKYHQPNSFFILHCSVLRLSVSTNISIACPVVFQPGKDWMAAAQSHLCRPQFSPSDLPHVWVFSICRQHFASTLQKFVTLVLWRELRIRYDFPHPNWINNNHIKIHEKKKKACKEKNKNTTSLFQIFSRKWPAGAQLVWVLSLSAVSQAWGWCLPELCVF